MGYYHIIYVACISSLLCILILLSIENGSAFSIHAQKVNACNNNTAADESRDAKLNTRVLPLTNVFREAENSRYKSQANATTHIIGQNGFIGRTPTFGSELCTIYKGTSSPMTTL